MTDDLEALASQVRRSLHWAAFLLIMMALILVIDLQLKKSIARQAVAAAALLSEVRYGGQAPYPPGDSPAGGGGGGDVAGDARLAAENGTREGPAAGEAGGVVDGVPVRAPGDGRRTQRPRGRG